MSSDIHRHDAGEVHGWSEAEAIAARRTVARHALDSDDLELLLDVLALRPKETS